jgi:hypothetical protein
MRSPLRILISSSPKTGNTWLLNLLVAMYDLPQMGLKSPFDEEHADSLGERWVAFQHVLPQAQVLEWIAARGVLLLTTVRHPGDVLISLYHHLHAFEQATENQDVLREMLHVPFERNLIEPPGVGTFADELAISIAWLRAGSRMVRYENLWRDPGAELEDLAGAIGPVTRERIDRAVEKCDIELMRGLAGRFGGFFRSGQVGGWRSRLSPETVADLSNEPYRSQTAELGYSLDPCDPLISEPAKPRPRLNPFRESPRFENGVAAAPIIADCYLSHDSAASQGWGRATRAGPGSYFEWLNGPCEVEGDGIYGSLLVSNLAHYAYANRSDLRRTFPRLERPDRLEFARWFVSHGESEFDLDAAFVEPMRTDLPAWVKARTPAAENGAAWPRITNLARHLYDSHPALQEAFPDLGGPDAVGYAEWFVLHGEAELRADADQVDAMRSALVEWANARSEADVEDEPWWPPLANLALYVYRPRSDAQDSYPDAAEPGFAGGSTNDSFVRWLNAPAKVGGKNMYSAVHLSNLAYYIYRNRRDLSNAFPDLSGPNRANYAEWFVRNGETELGLSEAFVEPVRSSLLAWGNTRHALDHMTYPWWPRLTNFALHLYAARPDVQSTYPNVLHADRWNFLQWTVDNAAGLNLYPGLAEPIGNELRRLRWIRSVGRVMAAVGSRG